MTSRASPVRAHPASYRHRLTFVALVLGGAGPYAPLRIWGVRPVRNLSLSFWVMMPLMWQDWKPPKIPPYRMMTSSSDWLTEWT